MADRGIRIPIVADVADWLRGTRRVETSIDDVGRDLDQLADRADRSSREISEDFRDAFRKVERDAERTDIDLDTDRITGSARDVAGEAGSEFVESWGESIRSGNPAEAVSETFTQAGQIGAATLGPVGAAAGLGIAAAAGLVTSFINRANEERTRITAAAAALFDQVASNAEEQGAAAAEAFIRGYVEAQEIPQRLADVLGSESPAEAVVEVSRRAEDAGVSFDLAAQAILGNRDAIDAVRTQAQLLEDQADQIAQSFGDAPTKVALLRKPLEDAASQALSLAGAAERTADANERTAQAWREVYELQQRLALADQPVRVSRGLGGAVP